MSIKADLSVFDIEGIELLSEYVNYKTPIKIRCSKGHITYITLNNAKLRKSRGQVICSECADLTRYAYPTAKMLEKLNIRGYKFISRTKNKIYYECDKGHKVSVSISNLLNGKGCPKCHGNKTIPSTTIDDTLSNYGYRAIDTVSGSKTKFYTTCPNNHIFSTSYDNFANRGRRCPTCSSLTSRLEDDLADFISSIYTNTIVRNDRTIIHPNELDFYFPDISLAIEFNGLYWHSESNGKNRNYHLDKLNKCNSLGINLITIFEDEWILKKDICKSRLEAMLGSKSIRRIYARKCSIVEIDGTTAKIFCEDNHLQGYGSGAKIRLGLVYDGGLVSVMTFSRPSLAKGRKSFGKNEYELHRFCSVLGSVVVGGASKLLKYFLNNYECDKLFTFADKRWSTGNLYEKLGFTKVGDTDPCYYYFKDNVIRFHRFLFRKNVLKDKLKIFDPNKTEVENMSINGYHRIWDCGSAKFIMEFN